MIGSALGRISTAERMSVDQLKEALQNKTLPAYIAVPLIEEKLNMNSRMQNMAAMQQAQQPRPPIADAVMQRAAMESGISALPSNLPVARGAGGGIVAFAEGGDADDEEDDEDLYGDTKMDKENEALLMRLLASRRAAPGMGAGALGSGLMPRGMPAQQDAGIAAAAPMSLTAGKDMSGLGLKAPASHKFQDKIVAKAQEMGVDPRFALYIAGKETGGLKNPETAKSSAGALGIMQLMPGTAKDMGVKDPFDPDQNIEGGLRYAKMMMDKYQDPRLAAIAYNWGPGNTDKWLKAGADMTKLPKETRSYVASLKEGGQVKRFQAGGKNLGGVPVWQDIEDSGVMQRSELVDLMTLAELQEYNRTGKIPANLQDRVAGRRIGEVPMFGTTTTRASEAQFAAPPPKPATPAQLQAQMEVQDIQEGEKGREGPAMPTDPGLAAAAQALGGEKAAAPSFADKLEELLSKREKSIGEQRQQDKYMALLAAGLGMMGGKSRYAAENIGQGALQGVASMQAANRQRAAEENALLSGRLGQYRIGQGEALRKQITDEAQQTKLMGQLSSARQNMIKSVAAAKKMDLNSISDPSLLATIEAQADAMLAKDPAYQAIYKRIYGSDFAPGPMTRGTVDYFKNYGLTPGKK